MESMFDMVASSRRVTTPKPPEHDELVNVLIDADTAVASIVPVVPVVVVVREWLKNSGGSAMRGLLGFGDGVVVTITALTPTTDGDGTASSRTSNGVSTNDQSNGVCVCRHHHRAIE